MSVICNINSLCKVEEQRFAFTKLVREVAILFNIIIKDV